MKQRITNISKKIVPYDVRIFLRKLNWRIRYVIQSMLSGNESNPVYCPIAQCEFKRYVRIGNRKITPTNGARERHRLVWLYLTNELDILERNLQVLHISPELSYFQVFRRLKNLTYYAGDKMVEGYSNQKGIEHVDLTSLEFDNERFDIAICNHVLEHIPDDRKAMSEMYRVLKPGGTAIVTVPINENSVVTYEDASIVTPSERTLHFGQWDHVRYYGVDISERLIQVGFAVYAERYAEKYTVDEYDRFGLCNDIIFVCKKNILV